MYQLVLVTVRWRSIGRKTVALVQMDLNQLPLDSSLISFIPDLQFSIDTTCLCQKQFWFINPP